MQKRRLGFWLYWILVLGAAGYIQMNVSASADVSRTSGDTLTSAVASVPSEETSGIQIMDPPSLYDQVGVASWYGGRHNGRLTASGERFDESKLTAAHRSLPLATTARVTNLENGRTIEVKVNDRGPYVDGRVIDLSTRAAQELGMTKEGLALVRIEVMAGEAEGSAVN